MCSKIRHNRAVYTRENKPRLTTAAAYTIDANTPYKWYKIYVQGLFNPRQAQAARLILAEGFWDGLIQAAAYLGRESVRINAVKHCARLAEALNDCCAFSVFNYIPDVHGRETRVAVAGK